MACNEARLNSDIHIYNAVVMKSETYRDNPVVTCWTFYETI